MREHGSPSDGSGLARPCASLHIGIAEPRTPAALGLQGGVDGALGSPTVRALPLEDRPPRDRDPEHLLKRSKERRAAIGGEEAPAGDSARAAGEAVEATPAGARSPWPRRSRPPPSPSRSPSRCGPRWRRAMSRKKIPFWAMPVLVALPLWAFVYQATLEPAPTGELTPVEEGGEVYVASACAGCHGAGGGGQLQRPGAHRRSSRRCPTTATSMMWVRLGSTGLVGVRRHLRRRRTSPCVGGMPGHARAATTRSSRSWSSTSGRVRRAGGGLGGVRAAAGDRRGRDHLRRGRASGEISAAAGDPRGRTSLRG